MMKPDKVVRIDGVAKTENGVMYLYGRTVVEMTRLLGKPVNETTDGKPIFSGEMYKISAEGIFVA